jgi:hypothetical protein
MILLLNLIELLIISVSFSFAINLVFFNLIFSVRTKFLFARIRILLVYKLIILKKTEIENIRQESYFDYSMLSFRGNTCNISRTNGF